MTISVKICGINDAIAMQTAVDAGARYVGLVFFPPSPCAVTVETAQKLASLVPASVTTVGLFVDPTDEELLKIIQQVSLGLIQLHGTETPKRVATIKKLTGLHVMKALRLKTPEHFATIPTYEAVADRLLFDSRIGNEPSGGPLDWSLLKGRRFGKPWMLAGGLNAQNLGDAVRISGATVVDVSSGVEDRRGHKNPDKIRELITLARQL